MIEKIVLGTFKLKYFLSLTRTIYFMSLETLALIFLFIALYSVLMNFLHGSRAETAELSVSVSIIFSSLLFSLFLNLF